MKRFSTFFLALTCFVFVSSAQSNYSGNGGGSFGGTIGGSTLTISEDATRIYFKLVRGSGNFNDAFVIYIDSKAGGFSTTSGFTDNFDQLRNAVSGYNGTDRSVLNFGTGFVPDYAIAVAPTVVSGVASDGSPVYGFAGLWELANGARMNFLQSASLVPGNTSPANPASDFYTFSVTKDGLSLPVPATFKFVATYLNYNNVYRSNEGYANGFGGSSPAYSTVTYTSYLTYPNVILPVKLISFTGSVAETKAKLTWQVANDNEIAKYEIEKSVDGQKFASIQTIAAQRTTAAQSYTTEDATLSGTNYYRLKTTDLQGMVSYSRIVQLSINVKGQGFTIFPNPVQQTLNLKMAKLEKGQYDVKVYSAAGQLVFAKAIQYDGSGNTLQVELPANLQSGSYNCILNSKDSRFSSSFLKQ